MTHDEALEVFAAALRRVAPEVDLDTVDRDAPLLDELELDSMDFLSLVAGLHERTGLPIPESDYPRLDTVAAALAYLVDEG
jgi:acyl carrier protein